MKRLLKVYLYLFCFYVFVPAVAVEKPETKDIHKPLHENTVAEVSDLSVSMLKAEPSPPGNYEVTRTLIAYFLNQKDVPAAEQELKTQLDAHPNDPKFWQLFGKVLMRKHDPAGAKTAFKTAAKLTQGIDKGENLYLLAQAYFAGGEVAFSETTLAGLRENYEFESVADSAIVSLRAGRGIPPLNIDKVRAAAEAPIVTGLRVSGTLTSGYDTNVALLPDSVSGVSPSSPFFTPSVQIAYSTGLMKGPLSVYGMTGYTYNTSELAKSYNNLPVNFGAEWQLPGKWGKKYGLAVSNDSGAIFLHSSELSIFSVSNTLTFKKSMSYGDGTLTALLPVGYAGYPGVSTEPINRRDGFNTGLGMQNQHSWSEITFVESLGFTHQFASGANFQSNALILSVAALRSIGNQMTGSLSGGYALTSYPSSENARSDRKYSLGIQINRPIEFLGSAIGSLGYALEKNSSNVASAAYSKNVVSLKVTYGI